jgi:hypothetical protein
VLLALALALWVAPFALGQRRHREISKKTLTFPSSLLDRQQPKDRQVQTTADSVKTSIRHQNKQSPGLLRRSKGFPAASTAITRRAS